MKKTLYKKQVLDAKKQWPDLIAKLTKDNRRLMIRVLGILVVLCLMLIGVTSLAPDYLWAKRISFIMTRGIIFIVVPLIILVWLNHQNINLLKVDRTQYSGWMSHYKSAISETDAEAARWLISQYQDTYLEDHDELLQMLKDTLKQKPANPLIVSVLAGLVFLSNDTADRDCLWNAKYKHGAGGSMIPHIWIDVLDPNLKDDIKKTHSECAEEFLSYWDRINKKQKKTA